MTKSETRILSTLKSLADEHGTCRVTHPELSAKADVHKATITRLVKRLSESGYIVRLSIPGDGKPSIYRVNDKSVPVTEKPSSMCPDGCNPKSNLERHVCEVLTACGVSHLHDVAYSLIHPGWQGEHRCDFLIGHNIVLECGREQVGQYRATRQFKREEAKRLGLKLVDVPNRNFATGYFSASGGYRWTLIPTEGLEEFITRIANLPHPSLQAFIGHCRAAHVRQEAAERRDSSPSLPKTFSSWADYNQAVVAARPIPAFIAWKNAVIVPPSAEEQARRAEVARVEAERDAARKYWGELLDDDEADGGTPIARVAPVRAGLEEGADATNAYEDGSWTGEGVPTDEQIDMINQHQEELRREYGENESDW